jgi:hypothetical protein
VNVKNPANILNVVIVISVGLIVLLGYFVPGLETVRLTVLQWGSLLAAFALLVGVLNLLAVHWSRAGRWGKDSLASAVLLLGFVITFLIVVIGSPSGEFSVWIMNYIQIPMETALLSLLVITLTSAAVRMLTRRLTVFTVIFLIAAVVVLIGSAPLYWVGDTGPLAAASAWLSQVAAVGGMRGLLLGISLGVIATGLRILIGAERPYGG